MTATHFPTRVAWALLMGFTLSGPVMTAEPAADQQAASQASADTPQAPADLLTMARGAVLISSPQDSPKALALTDGDPASHWNIATKRLAPPYVFVLELIAPAQLTAVGVIGAGERPGGVIGGSARRITVEGSDEGRTGVYHPLAEITAAAEGTTLVDLPEHRTVRWLRFTVQDAHADDAAWWYVNEFIAQGGLTPPDDPDRFTGVYQTGRATHLELKQNGNDISGCYSDNAGRSFGSISGAVHDGVALLEWTSDQGISGTALLTRDADGDLAGVRYRQRSRSPWGGIPASDDVTTPCSEDHPPANPIAAALENDGEARIYGILFNHDSDVPRSLSLPALEQLRAALDQHPDMRVVIEGHTDADGAEDYNQNLSARRADAVVAWLIERGIADERLESAGKGESEPVASNDTADGKALNRRVEVKVQR